MRNSKPREGDEDGRNERRRRRERVREARRRRKEIERRASRTVPKPAESKRGSEPEARTESEPKAERKAGVASKPEAGRKRGAERKEKSSVKSGVGLRGVPREFARRLSLGAAVKPFRWAVRGLGRALALLAVVILRLAALVERLIAASVRLVAPPTARAVAWLGRTVAPQRAATTVAAAAGLAAVATQALDYRAVAIGGEAYEGVASLATAPMAEYLTPWAVHGPLVGIAAVVAAVGAIGALRGAGRRPLYMALGAAGLGLAIVLAVDLTRAADLGEAAAEYAGTDAVLLEGFYIQLTALALIGFTALLPTLWNRKAA